VESLTRKILQQIVSSSTQGVLLVEADQPGMKIVYANPAYERFSGHSKHELIGTDWVTYFVNEGDRTEFVDLQLATAANDFWQLTLPFLREDGEIWLGQMQCSRISSGSGSRQYILVEHREATVHDGAQAQVTTKFLRRALGRARKTIATLDRTDPSTGLVSFDHFVTLLQHDLNVARREQRPMTLVLFEVVELATYRETFGVNAADSCVRMIATQLTGTFGRASDLCARFDESVLAAALPGQDFAEVSKLAEQVASKTRDLGLHNPRGRSGRYITVRSAVVEAEAKAAEAESLLDSARAKLAHLAESASPHTAAS
jgi:diguanylate cyclase (GGDEF)-like protein/PAS domain S-box-containing protein